MLLFDGELRESSPFDSYFGTWRGTLVFGFSGQYLLDEIRMHNGGPEYVHCTLAAAAFHKGSWLSRYSLSRPPIHFLLSPHLHHFMEDRFRKYGQINRSRFPTLRSCFQVDIILTSGNSHRGTTHISTVSPAHPRSAYSHQATER